jgi:HEPN domain-containing protein
MNGLPDRSEEIQQWTEKAGNDLRSAEFILTMEKDCPYDVVCFHAQQAVEKYLKAILIMENIDFPKTHDLIILFNMIPSNNILSIEKHDLLALNRYSVETRYPGDLEPYSLEEAADAIAIAQKVAAATQSCLKKNN